jgi:hypothetical protein
MLVAGGTPVDRGHRDVTAGRSGITVDTVAARAPRQTVRILIESAGGEQPAQRVGMHVVAPPCRHAVVAGTAGCQLPHRVHGRGGMLELAHVMSAVAGGTESTAGMRIAPLQLLPLMAAATAGVGALDPGLRPQLLSAGDVMHAMAIGAPGRIPIANVGVHAPAPGAVGGWMTGRTRADLDRLCVGVAVDPGVALTARQFAVRGRPQHGGRCQQLLCPRQRGDLLPQQLQLGVAPVAFQLLGR